MKTIISYFKKVGHPLRSHELQLIRKEEFPKETKDCIKRSVEREINTLIINGKLIRIVGYSETLHPTTFYCLPEWKDKGKIIIRWAKTPKTNISMPVIEHEICGMNMLTTTFPATKFENLL